MKKNTIKKSLSIMATLSLFAVSAACYSVSAAETDVNLYIDRVTAKAGETVTVKFGVQNSTVEYDSVGLLITFDEDLNYVSFNNQYGVDPLVVDNQLMYALGRATTIKGSTVLGEFTFTVPTTAKAGDRYDISFSSLLNAEGQPDSATAIARGLNLYNTRVNANAFLPYTVQQGYIEIAAEETTVTTEPTTTTTTTVTTPEVTDINSVTTPASGSSATDITTVSTPSSTTTSRATTTTARTTTTTKPPTTSSPKTGDATKGVIPAMAAMAAAALAAFVVRKKK